MKLTNHAAQRVQQRDGSTMGKDVKKITATVLRGKNKGILLTPHRYGEGHFIVSKGGNTTDMATKVANEGELENWLQRGYGLRMSAPGVSPSIYMLRSLTITIN